MSALEPSTMVRQARFQLARALRDDHRSRDALAELGRCEHEPGDRPALSSILALRADITAPTEPVTALGWYLAAAEIEPAAVEPLMACDLLLTADGDVRLQNVDSRLAERADSLRDGDPLRDLLTAGLFYAADRSERAVEILRDADPRPRQTDRRATGLLIRSLLALAQADEAYRTAVSRLDGTRNGDDAPLWSLASRAAIETGDMEAARSALQRADSGVEARVARALVAVAENDSTRAQRELGRLQSTSAPELLLAGAIAELARHPAPPYAFGIDDEPYVTARRLAGWAEKHWPRSVNAAVIRAQASLEGNSVVEGRRLLENIADALRERSAPLRWLTVQRSIRAAQDRFGFVELELLAVRGRLTLEAVDDASRSNTTYEQDLALTSMQTMLVAQRAADPAESPEGAARDWSEVATTLAAAAEDESSMALYESSPLRHHLPDGISFRRRALTAAERSFSTVPTLDSACLVADLTNQVSFDIDTADRRQLTEDRDRLTNVARQLAGMLASHPPADGDDTPLDDTLLTLLISCWQAAERSELDRHGAYVRVAWLGYLFLLAAPASSSILGALSAIVGEIDLPRCALELAERAVEIDPDYAFAADRLRLSTINVIGEEDPSWAADDPDWWSAAIELRFALARPDEQAVESRLAELLGTAFESPLQRWSVYDRAVAEARVARTRVDVGEAPRMVAMFQQQEPITVGSAFRLACLSGQVDVATSYLDEARRLRVLSPQTVEESARLLAWCQSPEHDRDECVDVWLLGVTTVPDLGTTLYSELPAAMRAYGVRELTDRERDDLREQRLARLATWDSVGEAARRQPALARWHETWRTRSTEEPIGELVGAVSELSAPGGAAMALGPDEIFEQILPALLEAIGSRAVIGAIPRLLRAAAAGSEPTLNEIDDLALSADQRWKLRVAGLPLPPDAPAFPTEASVDDRLALARDLVADVKEVTDLEAWWRVRDWLDARVRSCAGLDAEAMATALEEFEGGMLEGTLGETILGASPERVRSHLGFVVGDAFVPDDTGPSWELFSTMIPALKQRVRDGAATPDFGFSVRGDRRQDRSLQILLHDGIVLHQSDADPNGEVDGPSASTMAGTTDSSLDIGVLMPVVEGFVTEHVDRVIAVSMLWESVTACPGIDADEVLGDATRCRAWLRAMRARARRFEGGTLEASSLAIARELGLELTDPIEPVDGQTGSTP